MLSREIERDVSESRYLKMSTNTYIDDDDDVVDTRNPSIMMKFHM